MKDILRQLSNKRQSFIILLHLGETPLTMDEVDKVLSLLKDKKVPQIDLILQSFGGDINAAFRLVSQLRIHCEKFNVIVPTFAKSAATLICLGGDKILMDELSELGPLDTQIIEIGKGGVPTYKSALTPFKSLEQLRQYALETLDISVKLIISRSGMTPDEALAHSINFVAQSTMPLFDKINPDEMGEYSQALAVGAEYADRILRRYAAIPDETRSFIIDRLVHGYPSHDFILDYKELQELGLPAELFPSDETDLFKKLKHDMSKTDDGIFHADCIKTKNSGKETNKEDIR